MTELDGWLDLVELVAEDPNLLDDIRQEDAQLASLISEKISSLAVEADKAAWRDPREGIGGRPAQLLPGTPGSFSERTDWDVALIMGGRGCVAAGTEVLTPDGPVPIERFPGGRVIAWDRGDFRPALATQGYRKGRAPMFRVATARGDVVTVTAQHRFLTPRGWVPLDRIERTDVIWSHPGHADRSASTSGGPSWPGTPAGCSAGCRLRCRCGGPPPRQRRAADPARLPSPADAPARTRRELPEGDSGSGRARSRPCPPSDPLPRKRSGPVGPSPEVGRYRDGPATVGPIPPRGRTAPRSRPPTGPGREAPVVLRLLVPAGPGVSQLLGSVHRWSGGTSPRSVPSIPALLPPGSSTDPGGTALQLGEVRPCIASSDDNRWTRIVSVEPVGEADFWDMTVPGPANYVANGLVHHNSGKSVTGGQGTKEMTLDNEWKVLPGGPIGALVGQTLDSVRKSMIEETLLPILPPGTVAKWNRGPCELYLWLPERHMGARRQVKLQGYSSEAPRKLRGPNHAFAWADEIATWADADRSPEALDTTWSNMVNGVRYRDDGSWRPRIVATTTPRSVKLIRNPDPYDPQDPGVGLYDDPMTVRVHMSTLENRANLAPAMIERIERADKSTRLYQQEIEGRLLDEVEGALWSYELVEDMRVVPTYPTRQVGGLEKVVVAVDPSIGAGMGDECGIVVVGKGYDGHAYVLEDCSVRADAPEWSRKVRGAYQRWNANLIVAEANQGGELVREVIQRGVPLPMKMVWAKKNKRLRAEPVHAMAEAGRVFLAGSFDQLEYQMRTWDPEDTTMPSPDRLDAFVYAVTDLLPMDEGLGQLIGTDRWGRRV